MGCSQRLAAFLRHSARTDILFRTFFVLFLDEIVLFLDYVVLFPYFVALFIYFLLTFSYFFSTFPSLCCTLSALFPFISHILCKIKNIFLNNQKLKIFFCWHVQLIENIFLLQCWYGCYAVAMRLLCYSCCCYAVAM